MILAIYFQFAATHKFPVPYFAIITIILFFVTLENIHSFIIEFTVLIVDSYSIYLRHNYDPQKGCPYSYMIFAWLL